MVRWTLQCTTRPRNRLQAQNLVGSIRYLSSYCFENVKKFDYENFLATLLLPPEVRSSAFAVRAFNIELAQVKDVTSEELTARMRFEFWRQTLDNIYQSRPPNHPVAKALFQANEKHGLSKKWLKNMIDSRENNLTNKPFITTEAMEAYSEQSNSSIYLLVLQSMEVKDLQADHAASHLGKSEGIIKLIRGIPFYSSKQVVLIPTPILAKHSVSQQDIIRGKREQKVKDVVFDLASVAYEHLSHAKQLEKEVPKRAKVAFLPAVNVSGFLRKLQLQDFDIFDPKLQKRNPFLPFTLWWSKTKKTYS